MYDIARPVQRLRAVNENASGFVSKIPTITEPTGGGTTATGAAVLELTKNTLHVPKRMKLWPILLGSSNDVSSMRMIGWHRVTLAGLTTLWLPTIIGEWVCTAGAAAGIAGAAVLDTELFCDTIVPVAARTRDQVIAAGTSLGSQYEVLSTVGDLIAHLIVPIAGFEKLEFVSDQTTGTSTFNVLYSFL